jgi:hypothetical protein
LFDDYEKALKSHGASRELINTLKADLIKLEADESENTKDYSDENTFIHALKAKQLKLMDSVKHNQAELNKH